MEEKLIEFEVVKLAKEKGFGGNGLTTPNGYFKGDNLCNIPCDNKSDFCGEEEYSAPTQALLQRWIRETYDIHVQILMWSWIDKTYCYRIHSPEHYIPSSGSYLLPDEVVIGTYEEALEAGLKEALLLINT